MFAYPIIYEGFKYFTYDRKKADGTIVSRIRSFSIIFISRYNTKISNKMKNMTQTGICCTARTGDSSGEHIFRVIDGIQSGPVGLATPSSQIAFATILTVIFIEKNA